MTIKPKLIFVFILVLGIVIGGYKYFSKSEELPYNWALVEKGNIVQKVSATGQVIPAKKIDLQFEIQGKIKDIKAMVGEKVETGDVLAVLDTSELNTQVLEAEAARDVAKAKLDQVLVGVSEEEIKVYETAVENAEIALSNARVALKNAEQNLVDVKIDAQNDLDQAYQDSLNTLDDSYLKLYNAFNTADSIQRTYFDTNDQEGIKVRENKKYKIEEPMVRAKSYLDIAKDNPINGNIDTALLEMKDALNKASGALAIIRNICEEPVYRNTVSATDKTSLDTQRTNINTALTNIVNSQQTIASTKLTSESNINTAQSSLDTSQNAVATAKGNLKSAQDKLAQIKAPSRKSDVDLAQAQLSQAEASLSRAKQQLAKASLAAPYSGTIASIEKEEGEMAKLGESIISIISFNKFQIEVDIPEADVEKVSQQDPAEITLDAFPDYKFSGKVIEIEPAETIIQGVVYYKVTVGFDEPDKRMKSGMTANVDIITETKENVLAVPQGAVLAKDGQKMVRILEGKDIKEVKVETGIRGSRGEIEILSGLKKGDRVITFIKK